MIRVQLARDLRRNIMRGHPWVYKEALKALPRATGEEAGLCQLQTSKGQPLAWAIYDPHNPIAIRILSVDKSPPAADAYLRRLDGAWKLRRQLVPEGTDGYRLVNGEGDLLPGLICDIYGSVAVVQFDGRGPREFWDIDMIASWLLRQDGIQTVIDKSRDIEGRRAEKVAGDDYENEIIVSENGLKFAVHLEQGQKTGFFLDQRDNRQYLKSIGRDCRVLNLFSYTGGFSVYAGAGGASQVTSVDIAGGAVNLAGRNWELNGLPAKSHAGICADVTRYLSETDESWDIVVVDPPSMAHAEKHKERGVKKYVEVFSAAARRVLSGGHLVLSSCSSHISFEDFFTIINESLSLARRRARILRVSGQGPDHPFPHACHELRYLKFVDLILD